MQSGLKGRLLLAGSILGGCCFFRVPAVALAQAAVLDISHIRAEVQAKH